MIPQYPLVFLLVILGVLFTLVIILWRRNAWYKIQMGWYRAEMGRRQAKLDLIQKQIAHFIEQNGGKWCAPETDGGEIVYEYRGFVFIISDNAWGIDGEEVDFYTLLTMLTKV